MTNDNTCNGWRNAATWTVNLWFGDDFAAATEDGIEVTPEYCRETVEGVIAQAIDYESSVHRFIWDMLDLNSVDWHGLAEHHADMMAD